jgi:hypothetical protein
MARFTRIWRSKWLTDDAETLSEMTEKLLGAAKELDEMRLAGIELEGPVQDDYGFLVTDDPEVAERFGFLEEELEDEDD